MKTLLTSLIMAASTLSVGTVSAAKIDLEITNLTQNIAFTPLLVSAHGESGSLFTVGTQASDALQAMAEGGALDGLVSQSEEQGALNLVNMAGGPLMAAQSAHASGFDVGEQAYLSLVAMLLPTNDGFVGLDSWMIPSMPGTYTLWLNAYDAGTEANSELVVEGGGMPGVPGIPDAPLFEHGSGGSGVTMSITNEMVHIHPGNLGDDALAGGASDLNNRVHRWLNPVAKLVITVH